MQCEHTLTKYLISKCSLVFCFFFRAVGVVRGNGALMHSVFPFPLGASSVMLTRFALLTLLLRVGVFVNALGKRVRVTETREWRWAETVREGNEREIRGSETLRRSDGVTETTRERQRQRGSDSERRQTERDDMTSTGESEESEYRICARCWVTITYYERSWLQKEQNWRVTVVL